MHKQSVDNASTKVVKTLQGEMAKPIFLEQSVHYAKFREVRFHFLAYKHRVGNASARKGVKDLKEEWIKYPSLVHWARFSHELPPQWYTCTLESFKEKINSGQAGFALANSGAHGIFWNKSNLCAKHRRTTIDIEVGVPGSEAGAFR